jgi:SARP family transcriptional regulator, regulator of embCAB operon
MSCLSWYGYHDTQPPMTSFPDTWIQVCGPFLARIDGRRCDHEMGGRQIRELAAFLIVNRRRTVPRDELALLLWPGERPPGAADTLNTLLSRVRRACGPDRVLGRAALRLSLPDDAWIDIEVAERHAHEAESLAAQGNFRAAWAPARIALATARRGFLTDVTSPWTDQWRRYVDNLRLQALEVIAQAALGIGGPELGGAERAGRELIEAAPLRETGYRYLMEYFAARDDASSSLEVYESLRVRLRDELGTVPGHVSQDLHRRLLNGGAVPR